MTRSVVGVIVGLAIALAASNAGAQNPPPQPAQAQPAQPPQGPPRQPQLGQAVNVKVDVTITDQRGKETPIRKTVSMVTADGFRGSIRSQEHFVPGAEVPLNVDASPVLLPDGKVRVMLTLAYELPGSASREMPPDGERMLMKAAISENLAVILTPGTPLSRC